MKTLKELANTFSNNNPMQKDATRKENHDRDSKFCDFVEKHLDTNMSLDEILEVLHKVDNHFQVEEWAIELTNNAPVDQEYTPSNVHLYIGFTKTPCGVM